MTTDKETVPALAQVEEDNKSGDLSEDENNPIAPSSLLLAAPSPNVQSPTLATPSPEADGLCRSKFPWLMGSFVVFLTLLVPLFLLVPPLIADWRISTLLPMRDPSSIMFHPWHDTRAERMTLYRSFYFYNLTNPIDVIQKHSIPDFHIVGPFRFQRAILRPPQLGIVDYKRHRRPHLL